MEPQTNTLDSIEATDPTRPLVFLDTNVIVGYLHGEETVAELFLRRPTGGFVSQ